MTTWIEVTTDNVNASVPLGAVNRPVWRLTFTVPENAPTVNLTLVQVRQSGSIPHALVTKVALYRSSNLTFGVDSTSLASGTLDTNGNIILNGFSMNVYGFDDTQWDYLDRYAFLVVDVSGAASSSDTIQLSLNNGISSVKFSETNIKGDGVFPQVSQVITIDDPPTQVSVTSQDVAPATLERNRGAAVLQLTLATVGGQAVLNALRFSLTNNPGVSAVKLYRETGGLGWQPVDKIVGSAATLFQADRLGTFAGLSETLTSSPSTFYLVVNLSATATLNDTFNLTLLNNSCLTLADPDTVNAFSAGSKDVQVVEYVPAFLTLAGVSTAPATMIQGVGSGPNPETLDDFLRLTLYTDAGSVTWSGLKVTLVGVSGGGGVVTGGVTSTISAYLYRDNGNGVWTNDGSDFLVASTDFCRWVNNVASLSGFAEIIGPTPAVYFVAVGMRWSEAGRTFGITLSAPSSVIVSDGTVSESAVAIGTGLSTTITDRADAVMTDTTDPSIAGGFYPDRERAVLTWRMKTPTDGGVMERAALSILRLTMISSLSPGDISEVRLYRDLSGIGTIGAGDISLASATFGSNRRATLQIGDVGQAGFDAINYANFLVSVRIKVSAPAGTTFRVGPLLPADMTMVSPDTSAVTLAATTAITLEPLVWVTCTAVSQAPAHLTQGGSASFLRLSLYTGQPLGLTLKSVTVWLQPAVYLGPLKVTFWRDVDSSGTLEISTDTKINSGLIGNNPVMFSGLSETLGMNGSSFFMSMTSDLTTGHGMAVSLKVNAEPAIVGDGIILNLIQATLVGNFPPFFSGATTLQDTPDELTLSTGPNWDAPEAPWGLIPRGSRRALVTMTGRFGGVTTGADVKITALRGTLLGNLGTQHVTIRWYGDFNSVVPPSQQHKWDVGDPLIAVVDVQPNRTFTFAPDLVISNNAGYPTYYYLTADISPNAPLGETVGLSLIQGDPNTVTVAGVDTITLINTSGARTMTVMPSDADVLTAVGDSEGFPVDVGGSGISPLLRLTLSVLRVGGEGTALWTSLDVTLGGTIINPDNGQPGKVGVQVYRDSNDNNVWEPLEDALLGQGNGQGNGSTGNPAITVSGLNETVGTGSQRYFLVVTLMGASNDLDLSVHPVKLGVALPDVGGRTSFPDLSAITVTPPDRVTLSIAYVAPVRLIQGGVETIAKLTLEVKSGAVVTVASLRLSLIGTLGNRQARVDLYWDENDTGAFEGENEGQDFFLASSTFSAAQTSVTLIIGNAGDGLGTPELRKTYLVRLSLFSTMTDGATIGVTLGSAQDLGVVSPDVVEYRGSMIEPGFSSLTTVSDVADNVFVSKVAFVQTYDAPLEGFDFHRPIGPAALLRFSLFTPDRAILTGLMFSLVGDMASGVTRAWLYRDQDTVSGTALQYRWTPGDLSLATTASFVLGAGSFGGVQITLSTGGIFFIVVQPSASAAVGSSIQVTIEGTAWLTLAGLDVMSPHAGFGSVPVFRGQDWVTVSPNFGSGGPLRGPQALLGFLLTTPDTATLTAVKFSLTGDLPPAEVASMKLVQDTAFPFLQWTGDDTVLASASGFSGREGTLNGLQVSIGPQGAQLYLVAETVANPTAGKQLGLWVTASFFTVTDMNVAAFQASSSILEVLPPQADVLTPQVSSMAPTSLWRHTLQAFLRLTLSMDNYDARLTALKVTLSGTVNSPTSVTAFLYKDMAPFGVWSPGLDTLVQTAMFDANGVGTFTGLNETLGGMPRVYFTALQIGEGVTLGAKVGLEVEKSSFGLAPPDQVASAFTGGASIQASLVATPPPDLPATTLIVDVANFSMQTSLALSDSAYLLWITLKTTGGSTSVSGIEISLFGTAPLEAGNFHWGIWGSTGHWNYGGGILGPNGFELQSAPSSVTPSPGGGAVFFFANINRVVTAVPTAWYFRLMARDSSLMFGKTVGAAVAGPGAVHTVDPLVIQAGTTTFPVSSAEMTLLRRGATLWGNWSSPPGVGGFLREGQQLPIGRFTITQSGTSPKVVNAIRFGSVNVSLMKSDLTAVIKGILYKDTNADGTWQVETDASLGAGTFLANGWGTLTGDGVTAESALIGDRYFVVAEPLNVPQVGSFMRVMFNHNQNAKGYVQFLSPDNEGDLSASPVLTALTLIQAQSDGVTVGGAQEDQVWTRGEERPWLRLTLVADGYSGGTATWTGFAFSLLGNMEASNVALTLYQDTGPPGWSASDRKVVGLIFSANRLGTFSGLSETIGTQPSTYYLAARLPSGAPVEARVGLSLRSSSPAFSEGDYVRQIMGISTPELVVAGSLQATLISAIAANPPSLTLGIPQVMARINLRTLGGMVRWNYLNLSLLGDLSSLHSTWRLSLGNAMNALGEVVPIEVMGVVSDGIGNRGVTFSNIAWTLMESSQMFPVSLSLSAGATGGSTVAVRLPLVDAIGVAEPAAVAPIPIQVHQWSTVIDYPVLVNASPSIGTPVKGGGPASFLRVRLNGDPSVSWTGLKLSLTGSEDPTHGTWELTKNQAEADYPLLAVGEIGLEPRTVTFEVSPPLPFDANPSIPIDARVWFRLSSSVPLGTLLGVTLPALTSMVTVTPPGTVRPFVAAGTPLMAVVSQIDPTGLNVVTLAPAQIRPGEIKAFLQMTPVVTGGDRVLTGLQVALSGTLDRSFVSLWLYRETMDFASWNVASWSTDDQSLAFGTPQGNAVELSYAAQTVTSAPRSRYYLALSLKPEASTASGQTISLIVQGQTFRPQDVFPNGGGGGASSVVYVGGVQVTGESLAPTGLAPGMIQSVYRMDLRTDGGASATLSALTVNLQGNLDPDRLSLFLMRDENPIGWQLSDTRIGTLSGRSTFGSGSQRVASFTGLNEALSQTSRSYFIVLSLAPSAVEGATVGISLSQSFLTVSSLVEPFSGGSSLVRVDGPDHVTVQGVATPDVSSVLQAGNSAVLWVTLSTNQDTAMWQSLRLSLTGTVPPSQVQARMRDFASNYLSEFAWFGEDRWATLTGLGRTLTTVPARYAIELWPQLVPPVGASVGVLIPGAEAWGVNAPDTLEMTPSSLSSSSNVTVADAPDRLTLSGASATPPFAVPGVEQAYLRMSLKTVADFVTWRQIQFSLRGSVSPAFVTARLYRDAAVNQAWGPDQLVGTAVFSEARLALFQGMAETITSTPRIYILALSLTPVVAPAGWLQVTLEADAARNVMGVEPPDAGSVLASSYSSSLAVKPPAIIAVEGQSVAPAVLLSGTMSALIRLSLRLTSAGFATWSSLKISVTGDLAPEELAYRLYADDGDAVWNASADTLVKTFSIGATRFGTAQNLGQLIDAPRTFFLAVTHRGSEIHRTFGITLVSNEMTFTDLGVPQGGVRMGTGPIFVKRPAQVILGSMPAGPLTVTQGAALQTLFPFTLRTDQDLAVFRALVVSLDTSGGGVSGVSVQLYRETGEADGWSLGDQSLTGAVLHAPGWWTLSGWEQTLTSTPMPYYLVLAASATALPGTLALTAFAPWSTFAFAQGVAPTGMGTRVTLVDAPDQVTVEAGNAGVATHRQNAERVYLALTLSVNHDAATVTTLQVEALGNLAGEHRGFIRWYADTNANALWDPADDTVIASAPFGATLVVLTPVGLTVQGNPLTTFLSVQISLTAPQGATFGLSLSANPIIVAGVDTVVAFFAMASALKTVEVGVPLTLVVTSIDPASAALQGTARVTLLRLTLANHSEAGNYTAVTGLTVVLGGLASDVTDVWVESAGVTLGVASGTESVRAVPFLQAVNVSGAPVWQVLGALHLLTSLQTLQITLTDVAVAAPDLVSALGLSHLGSVTVLDGPDTVTMTGQTLAGTRILVGGAPVPLLALTAALSSLPQDAAWLQMIVFSLTGDPPLGGLEEAFGEAFVARAYKDDGDGTFTVGTDSLVGTVTLTQRRGMVAVDQTFTGLPGVTWFVTLSLQATAPVAHLYGGTVGLSVVQLSLAGVDEGALGNGLASATLPIFDGKIHIQRGLEEAAVTALTLGTTQVLAQLTLITDRDRLRLRTVVLTLQDLFGDLKETDVTGWRWYRENGGTDGWQAGEDLSLGVGAWVGGNQVSLWAGIGVTLTTTSTTFWVIGRINPFFSPLNYLTLSVSERYDQPVGVTPPTLTSPGYRGLDGETTLAVGAVDVLPAVVLTGETFPAMKITLQGIGGAVGVTRIGVRVNTPNVATLADHLSYRLFEGSRLLAEGGVQSVSSDALQVTFKLREAVFEDPVNWDVFVTVAGTAPDKEFYMGFDSTSVGLAGTNDVVLESSFATNQTRVISTWGFATIQVSQAASVVPSGGAPASRSSIVPVARLMVKTVESQSIARLIAVRASRVGQGYDTDARLVVYTSAPTLLTFDAASAVQIGSGAFSRRGTVITLASQSFLTPVPRAFWLVAEIAPGAAVGATWGVEIDPKGLVAQGTYDVSSEHLPFRSNLFTIVDNRPSTVAIEVTSGTPGNFAQGTLGLTLGMMGAVVESGPGSVLGGIRFTLLSGRDALDRLRVLNAAGESVLRGQARSGGTLWLTLGEPLANVLRTYALVADLKPLALVGATLQVEIGSDGVLGPTLDTRTVNNGVAWRSEAIRVQDAPDTLTLAARPRPVPWEVGEWTPMFLITLRVNQDEASLIRMTLGTLGNWVTGELDNFRMRIGDTIVPAVAQSLGGGLIQLSLVNYPVIKLSSYPVGVLELSLSPSINLTSTLGLSLLGVGLAPDPVTGQVADTVVFSPVGTSLLRLRNPAQPFPPALVVNARYVKGLGAFGATWGATVKQGTVSAYRYVVLSWKGTSPDFEALTLSLVSDPWSLPLAWEALTAWTPTEAPRLLETGLQLAHGMTLYVAVQAKTPTGPWSEVAFSDAILVDSAKPQFSTRAPEAVKGKKQMVLSWNAPESGPSGVDRYVVERRRGTKPTWEVLVSAQAPRFDPSPIQKEEWGLWYPSSYGHLLTGESPNLLTGKSGNLLIGNAPALQLLNYQIPKLLNAPIETKLVPYLSSTSAALPLEDGTSYYRVKAVSGAGETSEPTATTKVVAGLESLPNVINEVSNYPNPFDSRNQSTTVVYILNQDARVTVRIFTLLGGLVKTWSFESGQAGGEAGANEVTWDGTNGMGEKVATNAYVCVIQAETGDGKKYVVNRKVGLRH